MADAVRAYDPSLPLLTLPASAVHDVLGHNISLINVQATAALHGLRREPQRGEDALTAIKQASKDVLREMRATLGVLRQVDEAAPVAPAPGLARLDELTGGLAAAGLDEPSGSPRPVLSPRELDVLSYVAIGCTNAEAAERLGLLPETVKSYLRSAMRKLDSHTRLEAVTAARRAGLLP
ncbi:hypothetical protein GCM10023178_77480 [Actinomadura luteofluorescens]